MAFLASDKNCSNVIAVSLVNYFHWVESNLINVLHQEMLDSLSFIIVHIGKGALSQLGICKFFFQQWTNKTIWTDISGHIGKAYWWEGGRQKVIKIRKPKHAIIFEALF